jgi:sensor domain CHASE-containing protein
MDTPLSRLRLAQLTRLVGLTIALFSGTLVLIMAAAGWWGNHSALQKDRGLIENALNEGISRVLSEQKSVAWWDDAVLNVSREFNCFSPKPMAMTRSWFSTGRTPRF